jgi:hypothetical protein
MRFPIRPGKVTCAGIVVILMVLPNSIWKGPDAKTEDRKTETVSRLKRSAREIPESAALNTQGTARGSTAAPAYPRGTSPRFSTLECLPPL